MEKKFFSLYFLIYIYIYRNFFSNLIYLNAKALSAKQFLTIVIMSVASTYVVLRETKLNKDITEKSEFATKSWLNLLTYCRHIVSLLLSKKNDI